MRYCTAAAVAASLSFSSAAMAADRFQLFPLRAVGDVRSEDFTALLIDTQMAVAMACEAVFDGAANKFTGKPGCRRLLVEEGQFPAGGDNTYRGPAANVWAAIWNIDQKTGMVTLCTTAVGGRGPSAIHCTPVPNLN